MSPNDITTIVLKNSKKRRVTSQCRCQQKKNIPFSPFPIEPYNYMMPVRGKRRLHCIFLSALAFLSHDAESFCSNVKIRHLSFAPSAVQLHSSLQEDEYCPQKPPVSDFAVATTATTTTTSNSRLLDNIFKFDKQRFTKLGVAFAVTYNIISNLNGAITLSVAWYVASKRVSKETVKVN